MVSIPNSDEKPSGWRNNTFGKVVLSLIAAAAIGFAALIVFAVLALTCWGDPPGFWCDWGAWVAIFGVLGLGLVGIVLAIRRIGRIGVVRQAGHDVALKTNSLAIASLVLGLLSLYWIGSILAVILGRKAIAQIDDSGGSQPGRGMARTGVVLGWIWIGAIPFVIYGTLWG